MAQTARRYPGILMGQQVFDVKYFRAAALLQLNKPFRYSALVFYAEKAYRVAVICSVSVNIAFYPFNQVMNIHTTTFYRKFSISSKMLECRSTSSINI